MVWLNPETWGHNERMNAQLAFARNVCQGFLALALLILCPAQFAQAQDEPPERPEASLFDVQKNIVYTPKGWPERLKADVYLPRSPGLRPAVLLVHGGGWANAEGRPPMASIARLLAESGYVVVNLNYRVTPHWTFPAPIEDLHEALLAMQRAAGSFRIDPARIGLFGYSAGAHLVSILAAEYGHEFGIRAVVAGGTPADLTHYVDLKAVRTFIGEPVTPEALAEASPIQRINPPAAPVFLYHGQRDELIPLKHVESYRRALLMAGVRANLYVVPDASHGSAALDPAALHQALWFFNRELRSTVDVHP